MRASKCSGIWKLVYNTNKHTFIPKTDIIVQVDYGFLRSRTNVLLLWRIVLSQGNKVNKMRYRRT